MNTTTARPCAADDCTLTALNGHSFCRKHLDVFARQCRADDLAEIKRKRGR
jgi:hypothetical protein